MYPRFNFYAQSHRQPQRIPIVGQRVPPALIGGKEDRR